MKHAWVDANVILRHLTQDPPDQARAALALFRAAQEGRALLRVDAVTIAECVWVLTSVYGHGRGDIAKTLADFVTADGIETDDRDVLVAALRLYAAHNVDFVDALLAARMAHQHSTTVYSFDRDFDRLPGIERLDPGDPGGGDASR
jgi:predicted nucleic-acid-binding protein